MRALLCCFRSPIRPRERELKNKAPLPRPGCASVHPSLARHAAERSTAHLPQASKGKAAKSAHCTEALHQEPLAKATGRPTKAARTPERVPSVSRSPPPHTHTQAHASSHSCTIDGAAHHRHFLSLTIVHTQKTGCVSKNSHFLPPHTHTLACARSRLGVFLSKAISFSRTPKITLVDTVHELDTAARSLLWGQTLILEGNLTAAHQPLPDASSLSSYPCLLLSSSASLARDSGLEPSLGQSPTKGTCCGLNEQWDPRPPPHPGYSPGASLRQRSQAASVPWHNVHGHRRTLPFGAASWGLALAQRGASI